MKKRHDYFMRLALKEAKKAQGETFPNPMVGAVIVEGEKVVASGFHEKAGKAHAEVAALKNLKQSPSEMMRMYVTLEPCSTIGKTARCCDAIIKSGIKKIIVGTIDPNPLHQGRGVKILKEAGVKVRVGVLEQECRNLNKDFNKRMKEKANAKRKQNNSK